MGPGAGRGIAVRHLSSPKERGAAAPAAEHAPPPRTIEKPLRFKVPIFSHFSEFVAEDGSTWANIGLKMGQHRPTQAAREGNIAPR